jgi:hypothetical protein
MIKLVFGLLVTSGGGGKVVREAADGAGGATAVRERRRFSEVTWVRKKPRKEACAWVGVTHSA